jgi:3-deoxy-D-manno-octulosonic-acid transferase
MMPVLPLLLDLLYLVALALAAPWLALAAWRKGKYREGFTAKFFGDIPPRSGSTHCVWFHAVSVGEVNLLAPLLAEIEHRELQWECVISTTTMTGMALALKKYPGRTIFYCPLDFSWAVRRTLDRLRPDCLVLAELELWPNLVRAAHARGVSVAIVNGRLSERSFRGYRWIRPLVRRVLGQIDLIAAQNEEYAARFRALGATAAAVHVTGSVKYDGAQTDRDNPHSRRLAALAGFAPGDRIFLAGSTQEPEEALALDTFHALRSTHPELRLVVVPRHPDRFEAVARMLEQSGIAWQRRTRLETDGHDPRARVLLVDAVGELGAWWGTAGVAFVGGSLGTRGGQNMIEPAAYGACVSFGPSTANFRDIVAALLAKQAAIVVADGIELTGFVRRALEDTAWSEALGERAREHVQSQLGATARTIDLLEPLVPRPVPAARIRSPRNGDGVVGTGHERV